MNGKLTCLCTGPTQVCSICHAEKVAAFRKGEKMILKCTCTNIYQDKRYGKGNRVHNPCGKGQGGKTDQYRCVVCCSTRGQ